MRRVPGRAVTNAILCLVKPVSGLRRQGHVQTEGIVPSSNAMILLDRWNRWKRVRAYSAFPNAVLDTRRVRPAARDLPVAPSADKHTCYRQWIRLRAAPSVHTDRGSTSGPVTGRSPLQIDTGGLRCSEDTRRPVVLYRCVGAFQHGISVFNDDRGTGSSPPQGCSGRDRSARQQRGRSSACRPPRAGAASAQGAPGTSRLNSGSSSRKRTSWWARLTSPGRRMEPPPMRPASEMEWWR
jgi:hypothetical protein